MQLAYEAIEDSEFKITIANIVNGGLPCALHTTDWADDKVEAYYDAITFLNDFIKSAKELKSRIINDVMGIITDEIQKID